MKSSDLRLLLSRSGSRRLFVVTIAAALIGSALVVGNALLIAEIITRIIDRQPKVDHFIFLLGALWFGKATFQARFEKWCSEQAITIKAQIRRETTSQLGNYSEVAPSELNTILTKGLNALDIYIGRFIPQLIFAAITPIIVIATIFVQDRLSAIIAFFTLPLIPLFGALIGRFSAESVSRKWRTLGTLSRYFEDSLRGFATLKMFGRDRSQPERIAAMGNRYSEETMKVLRISFLSAFALELVATLSVAVVAVSIGLRLLAGSMDFKAALIVLILAPEVYFPVRNAASLFHASQDGTAALQEIQRLRENSLSTPAQTEFMPGQLRNISWEPWSFQRGGVGDILLPAAVVSRGEMLFIVGESGIGKSTFANNLLGITFTAGLRINGERTLNPAMQSAWQRELGWIPQNPRLAAGTVRDQFRLLSQTISDDEIVQALHSAGLSLDELPNGLASAVGAGGETSHSASGGQIRRIAVARALLRHPAVVIADEPTADLDRASAQAVMTALRNAQRDGAIVICITHDRAVLSPDDLICNVERVAP